MKARNILIILVINYLLISFVSSVSELWSIDAKAKHIQSMVSTAADMALLQAQTVDEFFLPGDGNVEEDVVASIKTHRGGAFELIPLMEAFYGIRPNAENASELLFRQLYDTPELRAFAAGLGVVTEPVSFWNDTRTGFSWYRVPAIAQVGLDLIGRPESVTRVTTPDGRSVTNEKAAEIFENYGLNHFQKRSDVYGEEVIFFQSPVNLGITYVNSDLLGRLFINNMDLLMRSKYARNSISLMSTQGGNGVLLGGTFNNSVVGTVNRYNPINDGRFTLLRGVAASNYFGFSSFSGITPEIEYQVIDMYDPANDPILINLFGGNRVLDGVAFSSKAEYLRAMDRHIIDPATGMPFTFKPIVVAKVTFYADIIIPFSSILIRELRANVGNISGWNNFIDLMRPATGRVGWSGNRLFKYTRLFIIEQ